MLTKGHLLFVSVHYGSWFDHIKGWTGQIGTMNNLLHITYEDMSLVNVIYFIIPTIINVPKNYFVYFLNIFNSYMF